MESEQDLKEDVPSEDSTEEADGESQETPLDISVPELCKPKMKVFHGQTAPGLRIRSAPTFMVSFYNCEMLVVLTC